MPRLYPLLTLLLGLLPGCSGPDVLNALADRDGYRVLRDLPYGPDPRHRLDVYVPETAREADAVPTLVFFYGGNWETGSKDDYLFVGQAFAARGYAVAIPNYRLYPDARYPDFLRDSAAAVAYVRAGIEAAGLAPGPVFLAGHSAGAYNAMMLTLDGRWLAGEDLAVCDTVAATVGMAGPYDFLPLKTDTLKAIFGGPPTPAETQPIVHADGVAPPPMLLVTGKEDTTVLPRNSDRLAAAVRSAGGQVELNHYPGIGHVMLVGSLAWPLRGLSPALEDIDRFLSRQLAARPDDC